MPDDTSPESTDGPPVPRIETDLTPIDATTVALLREIVGDRGGLDLSGGIRYEVKWLVAEFSDADVVTRRTLLRVDEDRDAVAVVDWPQRADAVALTVHGEPVDGERRVYAPISGMAAHRFPTEATALIRRAIAEEAARFGSFLRALAASPLPTGRMAAEALSTRDEDAFGDPDNSTAATSQWAAARILLGDAEAAVVAESTRVADLMRRALDDAALAPMTVERGPYGVSRAVATYSTRDGLRRHDVDREFLVFAYDGAPLETAPRLPRIGAAAAEWSVSSAHAVRFLIDSGYLIERIERVIVRGPRADAQAQRLSAIRMADPVLADRIERRLEQARGVRATP